MKRLVLAYSGGLDTSCCIPWLKDKGYEIICFSANLGSEFSPADLKKRAIKSGAAKIYVTDLRQEFAQDYILPALKCGAVYQSKYLLSTALGRPLIAKHLVEIAKKEKAEFVAHGCTGKGNDQVRIDLTVKMLAPQLKIIAPLREWELTTRESEIEYARKNNIPIKASKEKIYSIDKNIWGVAIEAGVLEDLNNWPKDEAFLLTEPLDRAPQAGQIITIGFEQAKPVSLNGKRKSFLEIIETLNVIGGKHCIGRTDMVEDRTVGIKSREVYEAPAGWILLNALDELESLVLDKDTLMIKKEVALKYSQLVYQGLWCSPLKQSLDAFINAAQKKVTGSITLKLVKGNIIVMKRYSPYSRYKYELATYGKGDKYSREDAKGFINIFGLPYRD
jgi:argininosuccinate synthase